MDGLADGFGNAMKFLVCAGLVAGYLLCKLIDWLYGLAIHHIH